MNNSTVQTSNFGLWLSLIPLGIAFLFAALMVYVAVISTENAREHYQAKKLQEAVRQVGQIRVVIPKISFPGDKSTPTPTPIPTPTPTRTLLKQMEYYETGYPISALPLLVFGLQMAALTLGFYQPKRKAYFKMSWELRKSIFLMLTSFTLSPAILILYIWALRIGLIG